ncbi:conserved hypothetical protein [Oleispira antarctica RB-8]|uniref:Cytochrome c domain-containing protein n=1 Tax=Oleispira antarctica RB-8 TaxID=698738 RepID=R4YPQ2_OLEAN|nr:conserved hypothetical protein [Oleispira antarctica RB-8]
MNTLRLLVIICFLSTLAGCQQEYSGDVGGASVQSDFDFGNYNAEGARLYGQQCAGCHGVEGNGTQIGKPLVACATCTNISSLAKEISLTMPIGQNTKVTDCDGQCANDVAEYIMYAFNGLSLYQATSSLKGVSTQPLTNTLRNATVQLAGRLPTDAEIAQVTNEGEAGFSSVMARAMNEDEFYVRLTEIFNDVFLTDKYLRVNQFNGALNLLDRDDYPNRNWYDTAYPDIEGEEAEQKAQDEINNDNRGCSNIFANDAVAREGLELINYIVRNNRPITELVTADYTMVNWYSQKVYDAVLTDPEASFTELNDENAPCEAYSSSYSSATLRYDPSDFKPAKIAGIPHAGILTSAMFLNRFPTTETNLNRHRSYMVYKMFLDTDILAIKGSRPGDSIDTTSTFPTLQNPDCYTCHLVMDPVASTFQHWDDRGRYKPNNLWPSSIEAAGLAGKVLTKSGGGSDFDAMLQWLGHEIAQDSRYIRAMTRHLYKGIIGQDLLSAPSNNADADADVYADAVIAYNAQRGILANIGQTMVADNWNIKTAITALLLSPYYRANTIDTDKIKAANHIGSARLLSPEMLQRKLKATLGFDWYELRNNDVENRIMFGGIDSDSVIERIHNPSGLMVAMQERMAVEMACRATAFDFTKVRTSEINERRLFRFVSPDIEPYDADGIELLSNIEAIKENIQYLHNTLLSESLPLSHAEIDATYQLFLSTWQIGQAMAANPDSFSPRPSENMEYTCSARWDRENNDQGLDNALRITKDKNYVIRSWMAVMTYLLSDYRYIYE